MHIITESIDQDVAPPGMLNYFLDTGVVHRVLQLAALKEWNCLSGKFPAAPGSGIHRADLGAGQRVERGVPGDGASERAIMEYGKPAVGQ